MNENYIKTYRKILQKYIIECMNEKTIKKDILEYEYEKIIETYYRVRDRDITIFKYWLKIRLYGMIIQLSIFSL